MFRVGGALKVSHFFVTDLLKTSHHILKGHSCIILLFVLTLPYIIVVSGSLGSFLSGRTLTGSVLSLFYGKADLTFISNINNLNLDILTFFEV